MNLKPYRKAVVATIAAVVSILHAFGVPVAADVSTQAIALFDAVAALLVYFVPNEPLGIDSQNRERVGL